MDNFKGMSRSDPRNLSDVGPLRWIGYKRYAIWTVQAISFCELISITKMWKNNVNNTSWLLPVMTHPCTSFWKLQLFFGKMFYCFLAYWQSWAKCFILYYYYLFKSKTKYRTDRNRQLTKDGASVSEVKKWYRDIPNNVIETLILFSFFLNKLERPKCMVHRFCRHFMAWAGICIPWCWTHLMVIYSIWSPLVKMTYQNRGPPLSENRSKILFWPVSPKHYIYFQLC